jgi:murein DD-endopeptidase MepM/ murein hydrolase activator NlpD
MVREGNSYFNFRPFNSNTNSLFILKVYNAMKKKFTTLLVLGFYIFAFESNAQIYQKETLIDGESLTYARNSKNNPCITPEEYRIVEKQCAENIKLLGLDQNLQRTNQTLTTLLNWPLKAAAGFTDCGFHFIGAYVDQNTAATAFQDYNCETNTYDTHQGTDIAIWPFGFYKMDNNLVEVVAAAPGTIVQRSDGNFDRNCASNNLTANSIIIQHADGTFAYYWHMKKNSVTSKIVGQTVVTGEYLGVVGSSGSSTGPHLHFEVRTANLITAYKDPFSGPCNTLNANSWWVTQRPHTDPAVLKVSINTTDISATSSCPASEVPNESNVFVVPFQGNGLAPGYAKFYVFMREIPVGSNIDIKILNPNGSTFNSWTSTIPSFLKTSVLGFSKVLPTQDGIYTFQATYNGTTCSKQFQISSTPVPFNISNFEVAKSNLNAQINWRTISEINTNKFELERSLDNGTTFSKLAEIKAAGNSSIDKNYFFIDNNIGLHVQKKNIFYRLKLIDLDGKFTYSTLKSIKFEESISAFQIYPTPTRDLITIKSNIIAKNLNYTIFDQTGRSVLKGFLNSTSTSIDLGQQARGIYFFQVNGESGKEIIKIIKL